jgi:MoxR-like ATPase
VAEKQIKRALPSDVSAAEKLLADGDYVAGRDLATVVFLALSMGRPLLLEGEAGVDRKSVV